MSAPVPSGAPEPSMADRIIVSMILAFALAGAVLAWHMLGAPTVHNLLGTAGAAQALVVAVAYLLVFACGVVSARFAPMAWGGGAIGVGAGAALVATPASSALLVITGQTDAMPPLSVLPVIHCPEHAAVGRPRLGRLARAPLHGTAAHPRQPVILGRIGPRHHLFGEEAGTAWDASMGGTNQRAWSAFCYPRARMGR